MKRPDSIWMCHEAGTVKKMGVTSSTLGGRVSEDAVHTL